MNAFFNMPLEIGVMALGLGLLLIDLWTPAEQKKNLGYVAAAVLVGLLVVSALIDPSGATSFGGMYVVDDLALFFKRFFIFAAIIVLVIAVEYADRIETGICEYYTLILFALLGMLFAASANDFSLLFVSLELITVTFYILTSFQRGRVTALEAGVKYLILGALSSGFLVYGIALVYGSAGTMNFAKLAIIAPKLAGSPVFLLGLLMVFFALGFKIAAFPFQIWAPDVYQGSPAPTTAFLAVGSKAAGFVLLLRLLFSAVPDITLHWEKVLMAISAITILYGSLCAIPQRNIKRLFGYSSISNAGFLMLGIAAATQSGSTAVLYFLSGYLFTVLAAFAVIAVVVQHTDGDDISAFAGLSKRSPLLAATMTLAMASLAGVPSMAGFFGKFLLLKAVAEQATSYHLYYALLAIALFGVVVSIYYYFGVIRAIYWSKETSTPEPIEISLPLKTAIYVCIAGILCLGLYPSLFFDAATLAVGSLRF